MGGALRRFRRSAFEHQPGPRLVGRCELPPDPVFRAVQIGMLTRGSVMESLEREGAVLLRDGQEHYYRVRKRFNANHDPHDLLFLKRSCFNGLMRFNKQGQFNTSLCRKRERFRAA